MSTPFVKFNISDRPEFIKELRKRVNQHFKDNNISKYANLNMKFKTVFMIGLYFTPLVLMLTGVIASLWWVMLMWLIMGFGMSGIGLSIMHDANHGSYSQNKHVNNVLGFLVNFLGAYHINWKIQHNVLHHTFTNVDGADDDLEGPGFLRFSPHQEKKKIHRYQHLFAWFPYSLMTFQRFVKSDYDQLFRYKKEGLLPSNTSLLKEFLQVTFWKLFYITAFLVLPLLLSPFHWAWVLLGFTIMHLAAGLILSLIFQTAHVMPSTEFPLPDDNGTIENHWAIHQMLTTANFARKNRLFSWFVGGLNYQVEHHLFANICHVHYRKLSPIVEQTAKEFGIPYNFEPTFFGAIRSHANMLRDLGK